MVWHFLFDEMSLCIMRSDEFEMRFFNMMRLHEILKYYMYNACLRWYELMVRHNYMRYNDLWWGHNPIWWGGGLSWGQRVKTEVEMSFIWDEMLSLREYKLRSIRRDDTMNSGCTGCVVFSCYHRIIWGEVQAIRWGKMRLSSLS